jgi:hypothetical protein
MILLQRNRDLADSSLVELASLAHDAEESGDDLTALSIMHELELRGGTAVEKFREHWQRQIPARLAQRRGE